MRLKIFIISFAYCLCLQINAQTPTNTIVNDYSSWAVLSISSVDSFCKSTTYFYFDGDSVIGEKSYKKVISCDDKLHENRKVKGLIREENQKTYFMPSYFDEEILLYDFSLEENMYFEYNLIPESPELTLTLYVSAVDSVDINGLMKKRIQIKLIPDGEIIDTWIEELGSLNGILEPCYNYYYVGAFEHLLCYFQDDELIYKHPNYSECYYNTVSIQEVLNKPKISVSPNPVDNQIIINAPEQIISRIEIFNSSGKKIYSQLHGNSIDVTSFSQGFYLLKIYETNGQVSTFKIIKK